MFSFTNMPSTSSVFSTYTTVAASAMLIRTVINEFQNITTQLLPQKLQDIILAKLGVIFGNLSNSQTHLIIDEYNGFSINEIYQASELYLSTRITPSVQYLKVSKNPREKNISITINKDEKVVDIYQGIKLTWEFVSTEVKKSDYDYESYHQETETSQKKSITLSFQKGLTEKVLENYLPYVLERSKAITEGKKIVKLHSLGTFNGDYSGGPWGSVNFDHPSTFETLAMDPNLKKELVDDLDRFLKRKNFYKRVGKAWKRGYLLYGPPGTGKSSLIAAMANYLKFDIYDLELSSLRSNSELRSLLGSTANRSILVIEDIDCSVELQDRKSGGISQSESQLTLSGLLNFIDGLWTCCGDERIIVFTTNHKDKLDPALLRPGRMDMHIHMSYCTPSGFKILASNYLSIEDHHLFTNIEGLINEVEITPAEIAEELLKSENTDVALQGLIEFLRRKKDMKSYKEEFDEEKYKESKEDSQAIESEDFNKKVKKRGGKKNKTKTKAKRNQG